MMKWLQFKKSNNSNLESSDEAEVRQALQNAHKEVLALQTKIEEYKWLEGALRERTQELNERIKELDCLYSLLSFAANHDFTLEQLLQYVIKQIPQAWQFPKATCARIMLDGCQYHSSNFRQTALKQSADIYQNGKQIGTLEIFVLPEIMKKHKQSFLNEEQKLLNAIALWIGEIISHKKLICQKQE